MPLYETQVSIQSVDVTEHSSREAQIRPKLRSEVVDIMKVFYDYDEDEKVFYVQDKDEFNQHLKSIRNLIGYNFRYTVTHEEITEDEVPAQ